MSDSILSKEVWYCHCCTYKNEFKALKCKVCGRPESYAQEGYMLPFHGQNATLFRPSQLITVLDSVHDVDSEQWTALHSASATGNYLIVKELLKFKGKVDVLTNKGQTPLHLAVHSGSSDCVMELIKFKADVNAITCFEQNTPLHLACELGYGEIVSILLKNGAMINAMNILDRTPLHFAATIGRVDIGRLLIANGANIKALDKHGWNALQIAELFSHQLFQELIIRETMIEKQVILKNLPPEKWHSNIWNEVVRVQHHKHDEYIQQQKVIQKESIRKEQDRINLIEQKIIMKRNERQRELEEFYKAKLPVIKK